MTGVQTCALPISNSGSISFDESVGRFDFGSSEIILNAGLGIGGTGEIGRASCRERV